MAFLIGFSILLVLGVVFGRRGIRWNRVAQLEVGMTSREIIEKVGKPYSITTFENGDEHWQFVEVAAKSNGVFSLIMRNGVAIKVPSTAALQTVDRLDAENAQSRAKYLRWMALVIIAFLVTVIAVISRHKTVVSDNQGSNTLSAQDVASVDCATAVTETLKLICATPALTKADTQLAKAYRDAVGRTAFKAALRLQQNKWNTRRDNAPADVAQLIILYEKRIVELKRYRLRPQNGQKKVDILEQSSQSNEAPAVAQTKTSSGETTLSSTAQTNADGNPEQNPN